MHLRIAFLVVFVIWNIYIYKEISNLYVYLEISSIYFNSRFPNIFSLFDTIFQFWNLTSTVHYHITYVALVRSFKMIGDERI